MNHEFENIGRNLPYDFPPENLDALQERIRSRTTARPAPAPRFTRRIYLTAAATAAAAILITGVLVTEYRGNTDAPAPDLEQMLATTPAETLRQAAAENYDDILYIQQL